jgi:cob(I)alamin adenosyltransferase
MMEKGLVHIYTGDGKGKTTAAIGLIIRATGHQKKVYLLQFLKGRITGEMNILKDIPLITIKRPNKSGKFIFQMNEKEKAELKSEVHQAWQELVRITRTSGYEVIVIDEIMGAITNNLVTLEEVIELIQNRDKKKELILTGRNAPEGLIELADYVTEMKMIKHPYQQDIPARKGIEF